MSRCHAQEIDPRAVQAVCRAAAEGRESGRRQALQEAAAVAARRARRARSVLLLSVTTALLIGFSAGLLMGAGAHRAKEHSGGVE